MRSSTRLTTILFVASLLPGVFTQVKGPAPNLTALIASRPELSTFGAIAARFPAIVGNLSTSRGTLFAPSNTAIENFLREAGPEVTLDSFTEEVVSNLLSYHYLPIEFDAAALLVRGGVLAQTSLMTEQLANLGGTANVVFASGRGSDGLAEEAGPVEVFSGIGNPATVLTADLSIEGGGIVHIIDNVLNFPRPCTETAEAANLSTLLTALETTELTTVVDTTPKFTCFAPTDEAFAAAGIDLTQLTKEQIADALKYHSIVGDVGYSTAFEDGGSYETLLGVNVTVSKRGGTLFINDVAVERANVIMTNGVAHVLSGVLMPPSQPSGSGSASTVSKSTIKPSGTDSPSDGDDDDNSDDDAAPSLAPSIFISAVSAIGLIFAVYA